MVPDGIDCCPKRLVFSCCSKVSSYREDIIAHGCGSIECETLLPEIVQELTCIMHMHQVGYLLCMKRNCGGKIASKAGFITRRSVSIMF